MRGGGGYKPLILEKSMLVVTSLSESPVAVRVDLGAIFVSMELIPITPEGDSGIRLKPEQ